MVLELFGPFILLVDIKRQCPVHDVRQTVSKRAFFSEYEKYAFATGNLPPRWLAEESLV